MIPRTDRPENLVSKLHRNVSGGSLATARLGHALCSTPNINGLKGPCLEVIIPQMVGNAVLGDLVAKAIKSSETIRSFCEAR